VTAALAAGELDLVVGTHALISEDVAYARLGLAVVDEQHRRAPRRRPGAACLSACASALGGVLCARHAPSACVSQGEALLSPSTLYLVGQNCYARMWIPSMNVFTEAEDRLARRAALAWSSARGWRPRRGRRRMCS